MDRRSAVIAIGAAPLLFAAPSFGASPETMLRRPIPKSGETLPAIGLGTWQTFDVGADQSARAPLAEVLASFVELGGKVIDSSPMYGSSETVVGDLAARLELRKRLFVATKVWISGRDAGVRQMQTSEEKLRAAPIDLMQVHNLVDVQTHLRTLREWKEQGRIRYLGVTHYRVDAFDELIALIKAERLDFVQLNYSILTPQAEQRVLPIAAANQTAVLVNRPFDGSAWFDRTKGYALPEWAAEFDCASWAQFALKYIVSNSAVTCAIPATRNPKHLAENMRGGYGRLPDAKMRQKMLAHVASL